MNIFPLHPSSSFFFFFFSSCFLALSFLFCSFLISFLRVSYARAFSRLDLYSFLFPLADFGVVTSPLDSRTSFFSLLPLFLFLLLFLLSFLLLLSYRPLSSTRLLRVFPYCGWSFSFLLSFILSLFSLSFFLSFTCFCAAFIAMALYQRTHESGVGDAILLEPISEVSRGHTRRQTHGHDKLVRQKTRGRNTQTQEGQADSRGSRTAIPNTDWQTNRRARARKGQDRDGWERSEGQRKRERQRQRQRDGTAPERQREGKRGKDH